MTAPHPRHVGFTGTQRGMTAAQYATVSELLLARFPHELQLATPPPAAEPRSGQVDLAGHQRGEAPLEVRKVDRAYELVVLGTTIGQLADKRAVCNAAFTVGKYRLQLGDFASTYIKGWCER